MSNLWLPNRSPLRACPVHGFGAVHGFAPGLGTLGVDEWVQPPSSYNFPDVKTYGKGVVMSVAETTAGDIFGTLTPPIQQHAGSLKLVLQGVTDVKNLVNLLGSDQATLDQKVMAVLQAVVAILEGALDIVENLIGASGQLGAASQIVSNAAAAVGVVGTVVAQVAAVVGQILDGIKQWETAKANANQCLATHLQAFCESTIKAHTSWPTGPSRSTTPADLFRQVAYRYSAGQPLPMNVGAMYVLLCGGESQGFGFTRPEYDKFLVAVRKNKKKRSDQGSGPLGIPPHRQRVMWTLIKGMMSTVSPAGITKTPLMGDSGKSIMPMLQDILLEEWYAGRVTNSMLVAMGKRLGTPYKLKTMYDGCTCIGPKFSGCDPCYPHATCYVRYGNCGEQRGLADQLGAALASTVVKGIDGWNSELRNNFQDKVTGEWTIGPSDPGVRANIAARPKDLTLVVGSGTVNQNAQDILNAGRRYEAQRVGYHHKAAAWSTAVVMGAGSFMLGRAFAKKRRR